MNRKQFGGILIFALGLSAIFFAIHAMHRINVAKGAIQKTEHFFTQNPGTWNPIIEFFGGEAQSEASKYDTTVKIFLVSGIILSISGVLIIVACRKRRM
jgi:hypothetical protein